MASTYRARRDQRPPVASRVTVNAGWRARSANEGVSPCKRTSRVACGSVCTSARAASASSVPTSNNTGGESISPPGRARRGHVALVGDRAADRLAVARVMVGAQHAVVCVASFHAALQLLQAALIDWTKRLDVHRCSHLAWWLLRAGQLSLSGTLLRHDHADARAVVCSAEAADADGLCAEVERGHLEGDQARRVLKESARAAFASSKPRTAAPPVEPLERKTPAGEGQVDSGIHARIRETLPPCRRRRGPHRDRRLTT